MILLAICLLAVLFGGIFIMTYKAFGIKGALAIYSFAICGTAIIVFFGYMLGG